jgi:hypothetical protein
MVPRLGQKYGFATEIISKPIAAYQTDEYFDLDLPAAPAVMVADEIVVEGTDVAEEVLEGVIRRHLGLPELEQGNKGFLRRWFGR